MDFWNRDSPAAKLLKLGYPVLCSNHTDPLSANNADIYLPFIEAMEALNVPYSIQSRGGKREDELLDIISKPIVWYVSIETIDPDVSRRISPGAPSPQDRLALIEKLHARGHNVAVGINPLSPSFLPDPSPLISAISNLGVKSVWIHNLHLSNSQASRMTQLEKEALGEEAIAQARKPKAHPEIYEHYVSARFLAKQAGLEVYNNQQAEATDYFKPYADIYPKRYPLMQEWVNHIYETKQRGDFIYWESFRDWFVPKFPVFDDADFPGREHLNALVHPKLQGKCVDLQGEFMPRRMGYERLLWFVWCWKEALISPVNVDCFAWAASLEGADDWVRYTDDNGNPILVFLPEGSNRCAYTSIT